MRLKSARFWAALAMPFLSLSVSVFSNLSQEPSKQFPLGQAYVTQAGAASQSAENYFGDNWDSLRTFKLNKSINAPLRVYVETHGALFSPEYKSYVSDSLNAWSRALNGRLAYTLTPARNRADITVDWVPSFSDRYVAGITSYGIGYARMQIKTQGVPTKDIKANIMHEFGHALGIAGHSPYNDDIMVATRRWHRGDVVYEPHLSRRDVQAIRLLYSTKWRKGEDLYSADAQTNRVIAANEYTPSPQVAAVPKPAGDPVLDATPVLVWNIPQPVMATSNVIRNDLRRQILTRPFDVNTGAAAVSNR
jgi:hypothetical protein